MSDALPSHLNIFQKSPVNVLEAVSEREVINPVYSILDHGPISFTIPPSDYRFLDLSKTTIKLSVHIMKSDGKKMVAQEMATPSNLFLHTLFKNVEVTIQNTNISSKTGNLYAYSAMLDVITKETNAAKQSVLQSELFFPDTAPMDDSNPFLVGNTGLSDRYAYARLSQTMTLEGKLRLDFMYQNRPLINGVGVSIRLHRHDPAFSMMSAEKTTNYKIVISEVTLRACYIKMLPEAVIAYEQALKISPAQYSFDQREIQAFPVQKNSFDFKVDQLWLGNIPKQVFVAMVTAKSFYGDYKANFCNFQNFNVSNIGLYLENSGVGEKLGYEVDYHTNNFTSPYLDIANYILENGGQLDMEQFSDGYNIYRFSINDSNLISLNKFGHSKLSIKFNTALRENIVVLLFADFQRVLQIDASRLVSIN